MRSLRPILYKISLVVLIGAALAGVYGIASGAGEPSLKEFVKEYDAAEYIGQVPVAEKYMQWYSPEQLLGAIEQAHVNDVCHLQGHAIGRVMYRQHPNFAQVTKQCGNSCTYGCFHGVMMELFDTDSDTLGGVVADESPEAYLSHIRTAARDLCTKPEVQSVIQLRTCYHGLGHVFESATNNNLDQSIDSCSIFADPRADESCVTGVFMEHFYNASSTPIRETKGKEPCDRYPQFTNECYIYKSWGWIAAWGGWEPAMRACDAFGDTRLLCIKNVARSAATREILASNSAFSNLCKGFTGDERIACVSGAILKIIYSNDGDDSDAQCDAVASSYRNACLQVLHAYLAANI